MALTWTNTSKTDLILPHGTVVPGGLTVLDRSGESVEDVLKNSMMKYLVDTDVLKYSTDSADADKALPVPLFNGGPIANSANTNQYPVAPGPASDPGPGSNPPIASVDTSAAGKETAKVVKASDGTHEVHVDGEVIASGLTKKEATDLAADPKGNEAPKA